MLFYLLSISDESDHGKIIHLYDKYHDYMMKYAVSTFKLRGRANYVFDAEDAVQAAFLKITKYIDKIDFASDEKRMKNYVFAILKNEIFSILKKNSEDAELNEDLDYSDRVFIDDLDIQEKYDDVVRAIRGLDEKFSDTLYLVYCEDKSVKEIAKLMGISPKTVYYRLKKGKILLHNALNGEVNDGKD